MENFTARQYINEFITNQTNRNEWEETYPEGLSLCDLTENDLIETYIHDEDGYLCSPNDGLDNVTFNAGGDKINITDLNENFKTRYSIV